MRRDRAAESAPARAAFDGPRAKKSLGQNFLKDANISRKIVAALDITAEDSVVEIGPGPGALTAIIAAMRPARLLLLEKDAHWAKERKAAAGPFTRVVIADALQMPWERFAAPFKCIGNLPYNVASPLMWEIFSRASGLCRAVFMVQKEVGGRLAAKPGSGAYGALSVWVQSFVRPRQEFIVPPHVFVPKPKVDSAVLSFTPLSDGEKGRFDPAALNGTLQSCFQKRRKQLGTIVRSAGGDPKGLESIGIAPARRPESLSVQEFHALSGLMIFPGKH
ncbi:16S rRNA (adenine(1518)-N(6)/adenine(1519)-N(6))-dimethyltransferase RsmA [Desulfovibrio sp. OttesenSCG-928-G15]|nr:16S rRNA (adenine(1518)-N(6)/adenine(1519)-N(6))-dimethyltransferase RsmA [Desulfovibrio sp. OttesenSCG-928-G15]